jgi:beta-barrel assembly-enhancing protease
MRADRQRPLMSQRARRLALPLLCISLLAGCKTMPESITSLPIINKIAGKAPDPQAPLPPPVARTWPDVRKDVVNQRARGFGLVHAPELQKYLNDLLARIKRAAGVPDWQGGVHVLASHALDAYATGAGNIYVSLQWLIDAQSEDELVAVLGHEFGHIYLHYHQLESAVADADTVTALLGMGTSLTLKAGEANRWNKVDVLFTSYSLGRGLATAIYSQSEETAADHFGLAIAHKLGYSYEHGSKAFLERLAGWEEVQDKRERDQQEALLAAIRAQAAEQPSARQTASPANPLNQGMADASGAMRGEMQAAMSQLSFELRTGFDKVAGSHPSTLRRIDTLAEVAETYPAVAVHREAVVQPLERVRKERRTALILQNYETAFKVIDAPDAPTAVATARAAASGPTATHAVPLYALYVATQEQTARGRSSPAQQRQDPGQLLEANFSSETDRAWITYRERSTRLKEGRQTAAAQRTVERGLASFAQAEEVQPYLVRFYGETSGWDDAKKRALACAKDFPRAARRCQRAAISPAEQAQLDKQDKTKRDDFLKQMFK